MSGIVGIYNLDGRSVESEQLGRMVDILAHRGPDGADVWCSESIGLGHRMLWTTPESLLEKLPLVSSSGDLVITADARIDNRDELISVLEVNDCPAEKVTDSQLILAAYEKWGEQCPDKLLGDFAFAIWDERKEQLFCARDHFGIKPFYYYCSNRVFIFASEIKALLSLKEVPRQLNQKRIAEYLSNSMMENKSITSYENIYRLPPGHILTIRAETGVRLDSYWSLECPSELKLNSAQEYADAFQELFTQAVKCRLRSAFPIGSHLSGGLDSSSVTCTAQHLLQQQGGSALHTFSNIFDDVPECDERQFINPILASGNYIPHYVNADRFGPLSEWKQFFECEDEGFIGPSHFLVWGLNRAMQQAGIRISLDGFDGDTTVSHGELYFAELARRGEWHTFVAEAKAVSQHFDTCPSALLYNYGFSYLEELARQWKWLTFAQVANGISQHFTVSPKQLFLRYGLKPIIPQSLLHFRQLGKKHNQHQDPQPCLLHPDFAQKMGINQSSENRNVNQDAPLSVREDQWQSLTSGLFTHTLELVDSCAASFSLESRHPFMDKRLIEFCLALPPEQKLNQGWSRIVMRRAMDGILPQEIQWRGGKTSMTPNFQRGLLQLDGQIIKDVIFDNPSGIQEFVNLNVVQNSYHRIVSEKQPTDEDIMTVWKTVIMSLWLGCKGMQP